MITINMNLELKKRFYYTVTTTGKIKPKAIKQIVNFIKMIINESFSIDIGLKPHTQNIPNNSNS